MQYGDLSLVYDALTYDMPYDDWARFIIKNMPDVKNILEVGCGTGNMTERLMRRFQVTALDLSEDMLDAARRKLMAKGDMCEFSLNKAVDGAICACDGINYLITPEKVKQAFLSVYGNIKTGGRFIFDISSRFKLESMADQLYSEDADEVTYIWRNSYDTEKNIINMDITFFVAETEETYFRFDEKHSQRAHSESEIALWLEECGFKVISVTDNYSDMPVNNETLRITFVAEKIER